MSVNPIKKLEKSDVVKQLESVGLERAEGSDSSLYSRWVGTEFKSELETGYKQHVSWGVRLLSYLFSFDVIAVYDAMAAEPFIDSDIEEGLHEQHEQHELTLGDQFAARIKYYGGDDSPLKEAWFASGFYGFLQAQYRGLLAKEVEALSKRVDDLKRENTDLTTELQTAQGHTDNANRLAKERLDIARAAEAAKKEALAAKAQAEERAQEVGKAKDRVVEQLATTEQRLEEAQDRVSSLEAEVAKQIRDAGSQASLLESGGAQIAGLRDQLRKTKAQLALAKDEQDAAQCKAVRLEHLIEKRVGEAQKAARTANDRAQKAEAENRKFRTIQQRFAGGNSDGIAQSLMQEAVQLRTQIESLMASLQQVLGVFQAVKQYLPVQVRDAITYARDNTSRQDLPKAPADGWPALTSPVAMTATESGVGAAPVPTPEEVAATGTPAGSMQRTAANQGDGVSATETPAEAPAPQ